MEDIHTMGEVAPALSTRLTPEDPQYHVLMQRLFATNEALTQDKRMLEEQDQLKVNLIANVSHELRTPLSYIIGFGSILEEESLGTLTPSQRECVRKMLEGGESMLRIVSDLLVWSQLEANEFTLHRTMISVTDLIQLALRHMQPLFDAKGQHIEVRMDLPLPEIVADGDRLGQVLCNLLDNACKFTLSGGKVGIYGRRAGDHVILEVYDNGIGMEAEHLERVFDRYYQIRDQRVKRTGGAGLGLSIVKRLVELHGGSISVDSSPDRGSHFFVRLPISTGAGTRNA